MTTTLATATPTSSTVGARRPQTRTLLALGAAAMPVWTVVAMTQALTREGFSLLRHPFSILSNGPLGWVQITNFLLVGALTVAGAAGLRHALRGRTGGTWAPRLVRLGGLGMMAAGVFVMDPADGFPVGTPVGPSTTLSWHGYAHMAAGSITFLSFIAACFVLARLFRQSGDRTAAVLSRVAGTVLLLGNGWAMSGRAAGSLTLAVGVMTAMAWISLVSARLRRTAA
ncbi:DUF998 domain-containing protein [Kitasatospora sp. NPDC096147]|uniref:DUF998 domain-containing protein n=1 Tax=Kitasatospora sp. NPDC096147 TaxID=3364093 RepID=UPI003807AADA